MFRGSPTFFKEIIGMNMIKWFIRAWYNFAKQMQSLHAIGYVLNNICLHTMYMSLEYQGIKVSPMHLTKVSDHTDENFIQGTEGQPKHIGDPRVNDTC